MRAAMHDVLGAEKYDFFFDKVRLAFLQACIQSRMLTHFLRSTLCLRFARQFLEYFFTDADARAFKALGLNCIRIPVRLVVAMSPGRDLL